ncbi:MAG: DUF4783 domain-containing protein [Thermoanaerobaculia bacterium]|nr:DUF4783 domain-containing protein [Thermoanaerobaculia bacterium]
MLRAIAVAFALILAPVAAFAGGYGDLDNAMTAIGSALEKGDSGPLVAGIGDGDKIELQFPGLAERSGFFGPDQAALVLDDVFRKASPSGFEQNSARKVSAEKQYHIKGSWRISPGGASEEREVYVILQEKSGRWSIISIRSAGR